MAPKRLEKPARRHSGRSLARLVGDAGGHSRARETPRARGCASALRTYCCCAVGCQTRGPRTSASAGSWHPTVIASLASPAPKAPAVALFTCLACALKPPAVAVCGAEGVRRGCPIDALGTGLRPHSLPLCQVPALRYKRAVELGRAAGGAEAVWSGAALEGLNTLALLEMAGDGAEVAGDCPSPNPNPNPSPSPNPTPNPSPSPSSALALALP